MPRTLTVGLANTAIEAGQVVCQVEVHDVRHGEMLLTTNPQNDEPRMKVVGGSIVTDETRAIVGTGTARLLVDEETAEAVLPLVRGAALSPTAPARVSVRFRARGETELTDYGIYEVDTINIDETSAGVVMTAEVSDNSRRVERARFWRPVTIANRTNYETAFHTLLDDILPGSVIEVESTTGRTGVLTFDAQDDRLAAVNEMATAVGYRIDWNADGRGNTSIVSDADVRDDPVWTFVDGGNARVVSATRVLTDERSYNGVIAMGEATGSDRPPVRAEFWDNNPNSPTYFDPANPETSSYGPVPFFYVSQFITTYAQALGAARARLPKVLGLVEVLSFRAVPNPGVIPGDLIRVERPRIGVVGMFIVSSVEMPLTGSGGMMSITCRERRIFL